MAGTLIFKCIYIYRSLKHSKQGILFFKTKYDVFMTIDLDNYKVLNLLHSAYCWLCFNPAPPNNHILNKKPVHHRIKEPILNGALRISDPSIRSGVPDRWSIVSTSAIGMYKFLEGTNFPCHLQAISGCWMDFHLQQKLEIRIVLTKIHNN